MRKLTSILLFVNLFFNLSTSTAQYYSIDFIENKGQWKGDFAFKGNVGNGSVFIEKQGYTVMLYNGNDIDNVIGHKKLPDLKSKVLPVKINSAENKDEGKGLIHIHSYRVNFIESNSTAEAIASQESGKISNYILGNDSSKWKSNIKSYYNVIIKNLYQGIDIRYYSISGFLKYDLIVHPGADYSKIRLKYTGIEKLYLKNEELVLQTSLGEIKERSPYSYQIINGEKKIIKASYKLNGNEVSYAISPISEDEDLIIDPTILLATFTGSASSNWAYTAAPSPDGTFIAGGIVFGANYPITIGPSFSGGSANLNDPGDLTGVDIGITRFSSDGKKQIYATYIGGNKNEYPHSIFVNTKNEVVILGRTWSDDYPYKQKFGVCGNSDIVITKLNQYGEILASTKIGGSENDGGNFENNTLNSNGVSLFYGDDSRSEVIVDINDNIYVASSTNSKNYPTKNAFQNSLGGNQDAVLIKINSDLSNILFSTFLGGAQDDAAFSLAQDPISKNIFVSGVTQSINFPVTSSGKIISNINQGRVDGFVATFSEVGNWINASYLGTNNDDYIYGVQVDNSGYPYIVGVTFGNWKLVNAKYFNTGAKQFISKLEKNLSDYIYSTVFGVSNKQPTLSPVAFLVDNCENVYVSAWSVDYFDYGCKTNGWNKYLPTFGIQVKPPSKTDGRDFYFFVLKKDADTILYASFFGQTGGEFDHVDGGTSRFDKRGVIYQAICANCGGNSYCDFANDAVSLSYTDLIPLYLKPVFASTNISSNATGQPGCNLFAVKIDFELTGLNSGIKVVGNNIEYKTTGCSPFNVQLSDTIELAKSYDWYLEDGTFMGTGKSINYKFINAGKYKVKLIAKDPQRTCGPIDSQFVEINVGSDKVDLGIKWSRPACNSREVIFKNISTSNSSSIFGPNSFEWVFDSDTLTKKVIDNSSVAYTFPSDGTHKVKLKLIDSKYCNAQEVLDTTILVQLNASAKITPSSTTVCLNPQYPTKPITLTASGGDTYKWYFSDNTTSNGPKVTHVFSKVGIDTVILTATDNNACIKTATEKLLVNVYGSPKASFDYFPNPPQENIPITFKNNSTGVDPIIKFNWYFGDGGFSKDISPTYQYLKSKSDNLVTLIAYNSYLCTDTFRLKVPSIVKNKVAVPNAFTPGGTNNKTLKVLGFGITKMDFKIYNRFGQLVFQSYSQSKGWDGTNLKKEPQPMDSYAYVLKVQFADAKDTVIQKNITLIR